MCTSGSGPDALLLNAGQIERRGRNWWRNIPRSIWRGGRGVSHRAAERQWPGGLVIGASRPAMARITACWAKSRCGRRARRTCPRCSIWRSRNWNGIYTPRLIDGRLRPDPSLVIEEPLNASELDLGNFSDLPVETTDVAPVAGLTTYSIQFDTPDVGSVFTGKRVSAPFGVRSANTSSFAPGGVSVMQVGFEGGVGGAEGGTSGAWLYGERERHDAPHQRRRGG